MTKKKITKLLVMTVVLSAIVATGVNTILVNAVTKDTKDINTDYIEEKELANAGLESIETNDAVDTSVSVDSADSSDSKETAGSNNSETTSTTTSKLSPNNDPIDTVVKNCWKQDENGKWLYYDKRGNMITGLYTAAPNTYYYFYENGQSAEGWTEINSKMYYFEKLNDGGYAMALNKTIDGYYLDKNGVRQEDDSNVRRGWIQNEYGLWCFYTDSGVLKTGLYSPSPFATYLLDYKTGASLSEHQEIKGKMYYFKPTEHGSIMVRNETIDDHYYDSDGVRDDSNKEIRNGWYKSENGSWYYYQNSTEATTGQLTFEESGKSYFFDYQTGASLSGWQEIKGKFYYYKPDEQGFIKAKNEIIDGYYVDATGARQEKVN